MNYNWTLSKRNEIPDSILKGRIRRCQFPIFIDLIVVTVSIGQQMIEQIAEMAILDDNKEIA
jgi:hypothetical protein